MSASVAEWLKSGLVPTLSFLDGFEHFDWPARCLNLVKMRSITAQELRQSTKRSAVVRGFSWNICVQESVLMTLSS